MEAEAEHDEMQGWERYELDTQPEAVVEELDEVLAAPVNTLEVKRRRKTIQ